MHESSSNWSCIYFTVWKNIYTGVVKDKHIHMWNLFIRVTYIIYGFAVWEINNVWLVLLCLLLSVNDVSLMIICVWQLWFSLIFYWMICWLEMMLLCEDMYLVQWSVMVLVCDSVINLVWLWFRLSFSVF